MATGCSTPNSVAQMKGQGARRTFDMRYDDIWTTVKVVMVMDDLRILESDKTTGYISARRGMGESTFGDNVAIWVRHISPTRTEVEVVSRRSGPPVPFAKNQEQTILKWIEAVLSS